jgi:hypothetical protein
MPTAPGPTMSGRNDSTKRTLVPICNMPKRASTVAQRPEPQIARKDYNV